MNSSRNQYLNDICIDPYKELASRVDSCLSISEAEFRNVIPANKK